MRILATFMIILAIALVGCNSNGKVYGDVALDVSGEEIAGDGESGKELSLDGHGDQVDTGNGDVGSVEVEDEIHLGDMADGTSLDTGSDAGEDTSGDTLEVEVLTPCCQADEECGQGGYCVGAGLGAGGVCFFDLLEPGSCFGDDDCPDGQPCLNAQVCSCDMNCVSSAGTCQIPFDKCCFTDDQCPPGMVCADPALMGGGPGTCEPAIEQPGACWDDGDCSAEESCLGASVCPCDLLCGVADSPGQCVPAMADDCCLNDLECGVGHECVFSESFFFPWEYGACKPVPVMGECWRHADCGPADVCLLVVPCPCGAPEGDGCDIPGQCKSKADWGCCTVESDCLPPKKCGPGNVCLAPVSAGQCWETSDCAQGEYCHGIEICPCGAFCLLPSTPGTCKSLSVDCCLTNDDCPQGQQCLGALPQWGIPGVCKEDPQEGCMSSSLCCWLNTDCPQGQKCVGSDFCGCDADCDTPDVKGTCQES